MRNSEWCRELVPKMRWSMSEGSISVFEWWWWFDQSDIRWRACIVTVRRLNRYKIIEIRRLSSMYMYSLGHIYTMLQGLCALPPCHNVNFGSWPFCVSARPRIWNTLLHSVHAWLQVTQLNLVSTPHNMGNLEAKMSIDIHIQQLRRMENG